MFIFFENLFAQFDVIHCPLTPPNSPQDLPPVFFLISCPMLLSLMPPQVSTKAINHMTVNKRKIGTRRCLLSTPPGQDEFAYCNYPLSNNMLATEN